MIQTLQDLEQWCVDNLACDETGSLAVARAMWEREDFPHPRGHPADQSAIEDFLEHVDIGWVYDIANNAEEDETT